VIVSKKDIRFLLYGSLVSFGTYFCMYAFRKPFAVGTFEGLSVFGVDYKIVLIIAQVLGYMLSKFIGIKLISELRADRRLLYLLAMIFVAELSLVFFGWVSVPYNFLFMFINGLSLGMIWGIVFSYVEGRKFTEILSIALCSSFILSSGVVKSVGLLVMEHLDVSEFWMPAATGAIFMVPFVVFAWLLEKMPAPTAEDKLLRKERKPMTVAERKKVFLTFLFPIVILVFFYMGLTALRDFRDNFSREIWDAVGFEGSAAVYTLSEVPVAILVLCLVGSMGFIKNNQKAFVSYHYLLILGTVLVGLGTLLHQAQLISPMLWMIVIGFGLYVCYVPFNGIFFDRMIATFRINGNAGYLIYIADAFGYLASVAVLLYKNFGQGNLSWLNFFITGTYVISILGCGISVVSLIYFKKKYKREQRVLEQPLLSVEP
jgi:MFS family permease